MCVCVCDRNSKYALAERERQQQIKEAEVKKKLLEERVCILWLITIIRFIVCYFIYDFFFFKPVGRGVLLDDLLTR